MPRLPIQLNATRSGLPALSAEQQHAEAKRSAAMFLIPNERDPGMPELMGAPEGLATDEMARRFLELSPPLAAVIPEFQTIINEIEHTYVLGLYFSAVSAACVTIERLLNLARIKLHRHHKVIKKLWGKEAVDSWEPNIDALKEWGYLDEGFAGELSEIYQSIRCNYLHSGAIRDLRADARRSAQAAYRLLSTFLGIPNDVTRIDNGQIEWVKGDDPRIVEFYQPQVLPD